MAALVLLPLVWAAGGLTSDLRNRLGLLGTLPLALVLLVLLHRALSYAEARGWIYYRRARGSYGGLGVTSEWLNLYDPSRKHLQQTARMSEWQRAEDDDGDGSPPKRAGEKLAAADARESGSKR